MKKNKYIYSSFLCGVLSFGSFHASFADEPEEIIESLEEVSLNLKTAKEKSDANWEKILATKYTKLPAIEGPGLGGTLDLVKPSFAEKTFVRESGDNDKMQEGRKKWIHRFGTVIRAKWVPEAYTAPYRFTGILDEGADYLLARFSLAKPPEKDNYGPGMGLKVFIDGEESLNIMAMPSLDGQKEPNIFVHTFSNVLPAPSFSIAKSLVSWSFTQALKNHHALDPNPLVLPLKHLVALNEHGMRVENPVAPYRLNFKPTEEVKALMEKATAKNDFRAMLAEKGEGIVLFEIWASMDEGKAQPTTEWLIGKLVGTSDFVASKYGDQELRFRHHTIVKDASGNGHTEL